MAFGSLIRSIFKSCPVLKHGNTQSMFLLCLIDPIKYHLVGKSGLVVTFRYVVYATRVIDC